jgi:ABC-type spermidine/putrescine transport system permease subunit II
VPLMLKSSSLALLLLMVAVQRTIIGLLTGLYYHRITHCFFGMAYATVVIQFRLLELRWTGRSASGHGFSVKPLQVFFLVTCPISRRLVSSWLLTFTFVFYDVPAS